MALAVKQSELPDEVSPSYERLRGDVASYLPPAAVEVIDRAYELAARAHEGQLRKSGEPYLVHLVATAYYLAGLHMDVTSVAAGLLHDTI